MLHMGLYVVAQSLHYAKRAYRSHAETDLCLDPLKCGVLLSLFACSLNELKHVSLNSVILMRVFAGFALAPPTSCCCSATQTLQCVTQTLYSAAQTLFSVAHILQSTTQMQHSAPQT